MERIGFFDLEGWEEPEIQSQYAGHELTLVREALSEETVSVPSDLTIVSVFVRSRVTARVLERLPQLKLVVTRSTGYDHVDLAACRERGVAVAYVPGYGDNTVAEYAFGLLLALTRRIYAAVHRVRESAEFSPDGLRGIDLKGKTIGIVGTGRIGREAIRIAKGFGMDVVASDPHPNYDEAKALGYRYVPLSELLSVADIVTLHAPYLPATHHLINRNNIRLMKKGSYLVNTARGGLVETEALVEALNDGHVAGAALDVLEEEGDLSDEAAFLRHTETTPGELKLALENHILMHMPNVLVSPHNAFNTTEAMARIMRSTYESIDAFLAGVPKNLVPRA